MKYWVVGLVWVLILPGLSLASGGGGGGGGTSKYLALEPPFVVNLQDSNRIRFVQIKPQVKLEEVEQASEVKHHMAMIRHVLLMLFSNITEEKVRTLEGKESLREESLLAIQSALEEETGHALVEQVYFTDFIIQ